MAGMAARLRVRQNTIELEEVTDMRTIKFRGRAMNRDFVFGLLTKKKIRSSGEIRWAIATGNCSAAETIPVNENSIAQLIGLDSADNEVYEGDKVISEFGDEVVARLMDNLPPKAKLKLSEDTK